MPVVAAALHSQVPAIAAAFKQRAARPAARVRDDRRRRAAARAVGSRRAAARSGAARRDDHVRARVRRRLRSGVGVQRARGRAAHRRTPTRRSSRWGRASWAPRPGSGSAASRSGRCSTPRSGLGGVPIACLRVSFADPRERHRGLSHHSATALTIATRGRALIPVPTRRRRRGTRSCAPSSRRPGSRDRHELVDVPPVGHRRSARVARPARSCRWAGPRPTIPCCSRPPPPQGSSRQHVRVSRSLPR